MHWPYVYSWRSERNLAYLSLKGSTWREVKWFPHVKHWSVNGSLLWFCTPAIVWLYLKHDPGIHTDPLWGALRGPRLPLPIAVLPDHSLLCCYRSYAAICSKEMVFCFPLPLLCYQESWQNQITGGPCHLSAFVCWSPCVLPALADASGGMWGQSRREVECRLDVHGSCLIPTAAAVSKNPGLTQMIGSEEQHGFSKHAF